MTYKSDLVPHEKCKQGRCAATTTGCWGKCSLDVGQVRSWKWSRPYTGHSAHTQIRIEDGNGRVILTGYCKSDDDAELIVKSVNSYALAALTGAAPADANAGGITRWLPMESAPKDGTMLRLLVRFDDNATEDSAGPCVTIGANTFDHSEIDEWRFAGWNWTHDCFTEGRGTPVGWLPLMYTPTAPEVSADVVRDAPLTAAQIEAGWHDTFSTRNPFCPCDLQAFTKAVRWAERAISRMRADGRKQP